jgi:hypothetical protein
VIDAAATAMCADVVTLLFGWTDVGRTITKGYRHLDIEPKDIKSFMQLA